MELPYSIQGPENIDTQKLLFWPNNPRLKISDYSEFKYSEEELLDEKNQLKIFSQLIKTEHDVQKLIDSMKRVGFMQEKAPIVMKIDHVDRYLVLEGNRRLAAIRSLQKKSRFGTSRSVRNSIKVIPCWMFVHTSQDIPKDAAISLLVAEAHIKGQKPHTKLQQAHMLYNAYEGFLIDNTGSRRFSRNAEVLMETAEFFGMSQKEFKREIAIVRLHNQLNNVGYEVPQKAYERLSWVVQNPGPFSKNFDYRGESWSFSDDGLEQFYDLFISKNAAVNNPATFRKFKLIMRKGNEVDVDAIRAEPGQIEDIYQRIKDGEAGKEFINGLIAIENKLNSLRVATYCETEDEDEAIDRISSLVQDKLQRLVECSYNKVKSKTKENGYKSPPTSIDEAMLLDGTYLLAHILVVVKSRPNHSCVRSKVPTYLLQKWGIRSRGIPRTRFCEFIDSKIFDLAREGHLEVYKAKNERVRIP